MNRLGLQWVIWHVTNLCNLSCGYCFTSSSPHAQKPLSEDKLAAVAKQINKTSAKLVTLIGGEPLTLSCLPALVETLLETPEREINMDTNGVLLRKRWSFVYEKIHQFNLSFDDIRVGVHNVQRGGYSSVLDAIAFLQEKNKRFGANITITSQNVDGIYETANYLLDNGAAVIGFSRLKPIGFAQRTYASSHLSAAQDARAISQMLRFYQKHKSDVAIKVTGFYSPILFEEGLISKLPSCMCGDVKVTITYDGLVYPCEIMPFLFSAEQKEKMEVKSVFEVDLTDILKDPSLKRWSELVYQKPSACENCRFQLYCNSGCRAMNYFRSGKFDAKDESCQL